MPSSSAFARRCCNETDRVAAPSLSEDDLRAIAGRASTIDERLAGLVVVEEPNSAAEREHAHRLHSEWRQAAADGDDALFARRLSRDGLDEKAALRLLGRARLSAGSPLPEWAKTFQRCLSEGDGRSPPPPHVEGADPEPFEELLWPFVVAARRILAERAGDRLNRLFAPNAILALERGLLRRLALLCGPGLFGDFSLFRHMERHQRGRFALPFSAPGSTVIYDAFKDAWRDGRRSDFFMAHPVAARLVGVAVSNWVESTAELIDRLARDRSALAERFSSDAPSGLVEAVETGLSDPHRGGRTVLILTFAGSLKLVYKPKDTRVDAAWSSLVDWINDHGAPVALRPVRLLVREDYGWCEFIRAEGVPEQRHQALYFRRAGGLLAVLHLLRASDFHHENVIPAGGFPVPVDLESLARPDLAKTPGGSLAGAAADLAQSLLDDSVLTTLYLPTWAPGPGGRLKAIGGVGEPTDPGLTWTSFRGINTDAMAIAGAAFPEDGESALGGTAQVAVHLRDFMAGFDDLYAFLVGNRAALLEPGGPLAPFRGVVVRVILQATRAYWLVQRRARAYANLADGAAWSLNFDYLLRGDLAVETAPGTWAMRAAEREAAAACDIPMFTARTDATWLEACSGRRIESCLAASPFDQLLARVRRLGDEDRAFQARIIGSTIAPPHVEQGERRTARGDAPDQTTPDLTKMAIGLGDMLDDSAIRAGDRAAWYGLVALDHEHSQVSVLGVDLMSGTTGLAVFCAALARTTGEARFRDLALAAITPARAGLTSGVRRHFAKALGLGGGTGVGSIIYGLVRVAGLLDEPSLLEDARAVAGLVDAELIATDRSFDVILGAAGAILGLLVLHRASGDQAALKAATACGRRLLAARVPDPDGDLGWATARTYKGRHLAGFSHGAAGIALALLRVYRATGDTAFRAAAEDALAYERKLFMPHLNNWPDFRSGPPPDGAARACQWCHGAAGIGLARVGCLDLIDDDRIMGEIEAALSSTLAATTLNIDHLCCGNFGRLDFLLTAGLRLDRPDLVACARDRATARVTQAAARGEFIWGGGDDRMHPGFFQGVSGIGYELLRLTSPQILPSVLLWD
jgi:type 2 lantibiotic biosynthesis protein LanM